jgi:hypothetical protein
LPRKSTRATRQPEKTSGSLLDQSGEEVGYFDAYGIYRSEIRENDPPPSSLSGSAFVRKLKQLVESAREELAAAGELIDLEITNAPAVALAKDRRAATSRALHDWFVDILERHDVRGRLQIAARFLVAWRELWQFDDDEANFLTHRMVACFFADAWHEWHMEVFGEHANAYSGQQQQKHLAKGTKATKAAARRQRDIILRCVSDIISESAGYIAYHRLGRVNAALQEAGLTTLSKGALAKRITRIRRHENNS